MSPVVPMSVRIMSLDWNAYTRTSCLCDSFAFIDFNSPKEATYALAVRANRFFRGSRKLNLQVSPTQAPCTCAGAGKTLDEN